MFSASLATIKSINYTCDILIGRYDGISALRWYKCGEFLQLEIIMHVEYYQHLILRRQCTEKKTSLIQQIYSRDI